jgi:nitrate reductase alpha subunit
MIDYNVRAERMGWLPSAPQLQTNPLQVVRDAQAAGMDPRTTRSSRSRTARCKMSCEDPDHPDNWPRNMFVWRSNILGSSGKGHEYFLKHLLGTSTACRARTWAATRPSPTEVRLARQGARRQAGPAGHARLPHEHHLPVLRHRAAHGHLVREERPQHQRHAPLHPPAVTAVDPAWQSRSDWEIYKGFAKKFSEVCVGHLGVERDVVLTPLMHDTPAELAQPFGVKDWKRGECDLIPGKTAPQAGGRARLPQCTSASRRSAR